MNLLKLLLVSELIDNDWSHGEEEDRPEDRPMPGFGGFTERPEPEPERPEPERVNLFHDVFRNPLPVFYHASFFEKFNMCLKIALIFSIIFGCWFLDGKLIGVFGIFSSHPSEIHIEDVNINDKETGEKFIKFLRENELVKIGDVNLRDISIDKTH